MIKKVKLFDKQLIKDFFDGIKNVTFIFTIFCPFIIEVIEKINKLNFINNKYSICYAFILMIVSIFYYMYLWRKANNIKNIKLKINNTNIEIKAGNIFEEKGIKVIAFNEYFDTIVDDNIISKKSLNGQYIDKYYKDNVNKLDEKISNCRYLMKEDKNTERKEGKKQKYRLGQIFEDKIFENNIYFLVAMTKFDENNNARLNNKEFLHFLIDFWKNLNIKYNNRDIIIPILGSGITRFENKILNKQEILNLMILTFKISGVRFNSNLIIINNKIDDINLYKLKELENI